MPILSIGESRPKKWKPIAALIQLIEGIDHSHSFITYKDARLSDIRYVAEARGGGCRVLSNHEFKLQNEIVRIYRYEVDQETLDDIHREVHLLLARPYGKIHLVGLLWIRLLNFIYRLFEIRKKATNPFKDGDYSQICVELSAKALYKAIKKPIPKWIEDYGLVEMHELNEAFGDPVPQEKIDKINGKKV